MAAYGDKGRELLKADEMQRALQKYNVDCNSSIHQLKDLQCKAVDILLSGRDCICAIPTGYGKSLIYEILPYIDEDVIVIVIVPLNAIINQQITKLGLKAVSLCSDIKNKSTLNSMEYKFLFCHPEQALSDKDLNNLFCSKEFERRRKFLVIDEAHCILEWGTDFRPDFKKLFQLRSLFKCNVLALSATITKYGAAKIAENLLMRDYEIVNFSPAKDNIALIVKERPSGTSKGNSATTPYDHIFVPVIEELKQELEEFPITIIFCNSMNWVGYGYEVAKRILQEDFYAGNECPENSRVVMFHSSMEGQQGQLKKMILNQLRKPSECKIRLIFSSVALGMGADLQHVSRIIHAGPPTSLETYVQEIGRAGRSGDVAQAILYFNKADLGVKSMQPEVKDYCNNSTICRRSAINNHFGCHSRSDKPKICCDICTKELGLVWDFRKLKM